MTSEKFNFYKNQEKPSRPNRQEKPPRPNRKKEEENNSSSKLSRREFLKKSAIIGGGIALGGGLAKLIEMTEEEDSTSENKKSEKEKEEKSKATPEQKQIQEENIKSITEVLDFDKPGPIELTPEIMESIKNHWKEKYKQDHELKDSLQEGYYEMGTWQPYLKEQFHQQEVPEKFVYLALPESHWQLNARSPARAVGPYQFTPETARTYGLKTNYYADQPQNLEERKDPIKSASACASLLKDLYEKSEDWDLALSGYNGGYFWNYLKDAYTGKQKINYKEFLKYLEDNINNIKQTVESYEYDNYQIKKGDNLNKVTKKFNTTTDVLCDINNIQDRSKIYIGQTLKIPISEQSRKKMFENKIKGMTQNLNYPPKFNAVYELIQENFVEEQKQPLSFNSKKVETKPQKYTFKKEDKNIYQLSQNFPNISAKNILQANPNINSDNLQGGEKLTIPSLTTQPTLNSIADDNNEKIDRLKNLNPAIENPDLPIPKGYEVRS